MLVQAKDDNNNIYYVVVSTSLGDVLCLGSEVCGRWDQQVVELVPKLAREGAQGLHVQVRRGIALALQHRWWAILGLALRPSYAHIVLSSAAGVDLIAAGRANWMMTGRLAA